LGVSVDFNQANQAWAEKIGITYPLLSDAQRIVSRAYGALNDDPKMAEDPNQIRTCARSARGSSLTKGA
jgi:peroxiredoxin